MSGTIGGWPDGRWLAGDTVKLSLGDRFWRTHDGETRPGYVWVEYDAPVFVPPPPLCTDCHAAAYGYEPYMGDPLASFGPGTCSQCGTTDETVWTLTESLP